MTARLGSVAAVGLLPWSLVGLTQVSFAWGLLRRPGTAAAPVGTLLCFAVVWWFDWPALRDALV